MSPISALGFVDVWDTPQETERFLFIPSNEQKRRQHHGSFIHELLQQRSKLGASMLLCIIIGSGPV